MSHMTHYTKLVMMQHQLPSGWHQGSCETPLSGVPRLRAGGLEWQVGSARTHSQTPALCWGQGGGAGGGHARLREGGCAIDALLTHHTAAQQRDRSRRHNLRRRLAATDAGRLLGGCQV
eukprot:Hpha_TRINITY_DN15485_c0_g1::TRINITY_DN15485_c0_g1_i2::g.177063::m.177063